MKNSKIISTTLTLASLLIAANALARTSPTVEFNPAQIEQPAVLDSSVPPITPGTPTRPTSTLPSGTDLMPRPQIDPNALDPDVTEPKDHKVNLAKLITKAVKQSAMAHTVKEVSDASTTLSAEDKATLDDTIKAVLDLQPGSFKPDKEPKGTVEAPVAPAAEVTE